LGGFAGSVAVGTVIGWSMSNVGAVAPELSRDYRLSIATVGLLTTVVLAVHTAMQIPAGRVVDRFGPKRVGLLGLGLIAAVNAVTLIAAEPWLVFVGRTTLGVGTGFAFVAAIEYSRQVSGSPLVLGLFGASTGLGGGLAVAIVPQVEQLVHWRAPFLTACGLALVGLLVLAGGPPGRAVERGAPLPAGAVGAVLRDRRVWRVGLSMAAPSGMSLILGTWVVTLLVKAGGYSTREAGLIGSLVLVAGIVTRPISGWVMRSHPYAMRKVIVGSIVAGVGGTAAVTEARRLPLVILGSLVVGLCSGLPFAYGYTTAARIRPDGPAVAAAIVNTCGLLLIVVCVPLVGLTFSMPGHGRIGFIVAAALWGVSVLFLPDRHGEGVSVAAPAEAPSSSGP
jgi:MFS family permease